MMTLMMMMMMMTTTTTTTMTMTMTMTVMMLMMMMMMMLMMMTAKSGGVVVVGVVIIMILKHCFYFQLCQGNEGTRVIPRYEQTAFISFFRLVAGTDGMKKKRSIITFGIRSKILLRSLSWNSSSENLQGNFSTLKNCQIPSKSIWFVLPSRFTTRL